MGEKGGKMRKCTSGALAALGGFASGVFGALGGIVLNRITAKVNPKKGGDAIRDNYACTLFIMIAVSAVSAAVLRASGRIQRFLRAADGARRRLRGRDLGRRPVRQGEHDHSEGSVRCDHNMGGDTDAYVTQRNFEKKGADSE